MAVTKDPPETLREAVLYFDDFDQCKEFMVALRWPDGVVRCPTCDSDRVTWLPSRRKWRCATKHPLREFTLKTGTLFEDSPLPLSKWLPTVWQVVNCKNGISSCEIAREVGVTQKTAWFMGHRIRAALHTGSFDKLAGEVEVDETFIGGKARNMHNAQKKRRIAAAGSMMADKTIVLGMLERGGKVTTAVVPRRTKKKLHAKVKQHVAAGSALYSDELKSYEGLDKDYAHKVINHAVKYVDGKIHTNGMGELLEPAQAGARRHLRSGRALPPVPLPGRAGVPLQRAARVEPGPVQAGFGAGRREAADLRAVERPVPRPGALIGAAPAAAARPAGETSARISAACSGDNDRIAFIPPKNRSHFADASASLVAIGQHYTRSRRIVAAAGSGGTGRRASS